MTNPRVRHTRARQTLGHIAHVERDRPDRWDVDFGVSQATWTALQAAVDLRREVRDD